MKIKIYETLNIKFTTLSIITLHLQIIFFVHSVHCLLYTMHTVYTIFTSFLLVVYYFIIAHIILVFEQIIENVLIVFYFLNLYFKYFIIAIHVSSNACSQNI